MGTPRRKAWPVGQVVKTAASHAVNIGSNPVRVTIPKKRCFFGNRKLDNWIKVCYCMKAVAIQQLVLIRARVHPFPSRTRKLSSLLLTILGWRRPGKIGSANTKPTTFVVGFVFVSTPLSAAGLYLNYALGGGLISELRAPPDPPAPRRLPGQR